MNIILVFFATIASSTSLQLLSEWTTFKKRYQKEYEPMEDITRKNNYYVNKERIYTHNTKYDMGTSSFRLAINQFGDWRENEFYNIFQSRSSYRSAITNETDKWIGKNRVARDTSRKGRSNDYRDWRMERAVNPIRDQTMMGKSMCNAGWAFAAVAAMEARDSKYPSGLQQFSEQNLIDCISPKNGCQGLLPANAFEYVRDRGNINMRKNYPYTGSSGRCKYDEDDFGTAGPDVRPITPLDEDELLEAIEEEGPVVVGFDPLSFTFMFYSSGIYNEKSCSSSYTNQLHHMTIVAFESEIEEGDYWVVRNSFGSAWGESGYMRIPRNVNQCGIADAPVYLNL